MRLFILLMAAVTLAVFTLTACNSRDGSGRSAAKTNASTPATSTQASPTSDGVQRITTVELRNALAKGEAIVIDVRSEAAYNNGHIKGARLIPAAEIASHLNELPRDKMIVTYCS